MEHRQRISRYDQPIRPQNRLCSLTVTPICTPYPNPHWFVPELLTHSSLGSSRLSAIQRGLLAASQPLPSQTDSPLLLPLTGLMFPLPPVWFGIALWTNLHIEPMDLGEWEGR
ncbi:hypothetical protein F9C07_3897 [Aspergillus flavus]|uniref:Uncharacterized protein n=1 Tax=Aspergillus flavus (strain ATCC 200026 / FGSC A1120 / IAM 13836 / NRRL 3357 / JCM 12722 / SRRC 167) TaxID=332952 RepID=A0A7U2MUM6_ASPFN|nr:hypothetical protein F9C07_3897 [Aspergillus flavus]